MDWFIYNTLLLTGWSSRFPWAIRRLGVKGAGGERNASNNGSNGNNGDDDSNAGNYF